MDMRQLVMLGRGYLIINNDDSFSYMELPRKLLETLTERQKRLGMRAAIPEYAVRRKLPRPKYSQQIPGICRVWFVESNKIK
jgi:hypothetical protein